jgi:hypothetical protein
LMTGENEWDGKNREAWVVKKRPHYTLGAPGVKTDTAKSNWTYSRANEGISEVIWLIKHRIGRRFEWYWYRGVSSQKLYRRDSNSACERSQMNRLLTEQSKESVMKPLDRSLWARCQGWKSTGDLSTTPSRV